MCYELNGNCGQLLPIVDSLPNLCPIAWPTVDSNNAETNWNKNELLLCQSIRWFGYHCIPNILRTKLTFDLINEIWAMNKCFHWCWLIYGIIVYTIARNCLSLKTSICCSIPSQGWVMSVLSVSDGIDTIEAVIHFISANDWFGAHVLASVGCVGCVGSVGCVGHSI